jgi:hypothetical protein
MRMNITKNICVISIIALVGLISGCSTPLVVTTPVGPRPFGNESTSSTGALEVFSFLTLCSEGDDPIWFQHTDYYLCTPQNQVLKHVSNITGKYETAPRRLDLPGGNYIIKAQAKGYIWVEVPVIVEPGRTTRVHLDGEWIPAANLPKAQIVNGPGGPMGWRDDFAENAGTKQLLQMAALRIAAIAYNATIREANRFARIRSC